MPGKDLVPVPSRPRNGGNRWPYAGPGRFPTYTDEVWNEILRRTAEGEPMAWICRDEDLPSTRTVYDKIQNDPEFAAELEVCQRLGHDARAAWVLEESLYPREAEERTVRHGPKGVEVTIKKFDNVNRSRLVVDTTMRLLGQWDARYRRQAEQEMLERERGGEETIKVEGGLPEEVKSNGALNGAHTVDEVIKDMEDPTNGETP